MQLVRCAAAVPRPQASGGAEPTAAERADSVAPIAWASAAQGVIAAVVLTLLFVALGALVFGIYGFGLFVASPFIVGAVTLGPGRTSIMQGAVQLVVFAAFLFLSMVP